MAGWGRTYDHGTPIGGWENVPAGDLAPGQTICFSRNFGHDEIGMVRLEALYARRMPVMFMVYGRVVSVVRDGAIWLVEVEIYNECFVHASGMAEQYMFADVKKVKRSRDHSMGSSPVFKFKFTEEQPVTVILDGR